MHVFESPSRKSHTWRSPHSSYQPWFIILQAFVIIHTILTGLHIQGACMCDRNRWAFRLAVSNEGLHIWGKLWSEHRGRLSPRGEKRWKRGKTRTWVQWGSRSGGFYKDFWGLSDFESQEHTAIGGTNSSKKLNSAVFWVSDTQTHLMSAESLYT